MRIKLSLMVVLIGGLIGLASAQTMPSPQPTLGSPNAPFEIVIFEDFNCPHCRSFHQSYYAQLVKDFVVTDRARLVFLNYPFVKDTSDDLALASECIYAQGNITYWLYKDKFYSYYDQHPETNWSDSQIINFVESLDLHLDSDAFANCLRSDRLMTHVTADADYAQALGLGGVPNVMINGEVLGSVGLEDIQAYIESRE